MSHQDDKKGPGLAGPAAKEMYERVTAWSQRWCRGNPIDALDLTHDVVVEVLNSIHQFRGESKLTTWVWPIFYRVARRWRSRYYDGEVPQDVPPESVDIELLLDLMRIFSPAEKSILVRGIVHFELVKERYYDGLDLVVIAGRRGITAQRAAEYISRALRQLRDRICRSDGG